MPVSDEPLSEVRERMAKALADTVEGKEVRKIRARLQEGGSVWFWFGMMGLVGWAVSIPTILGVFLGRWLDARFPGPPSWTLTLLLLGLALGCWNAWRWIREESEE